MKQRPRTLLSKIEYLGFLSIALAACGDDGPSTADTGTSDTSELADSSAPDTTAPEVTPDTTGDTSETTGQPDTTGGTGITTDPSAVTTSIVDGHSRTSVAASSSAHWTHLSLTTGELAIPAPAGDDTFHLGFQRYLVKLGEGVAALTLDGVAFASLTAAPSRDESEWKVDGPTPETAAISDWWDYDGRTHTLTAKPERLYVLRADGRYFKVWFRDYYDEGGSPGLVTFDWAEIAAPEVAGE
jgi:hypothetical protein